MRSWSVVRVGSGIALAALVACSGGDKDTTTTDDPPDDTGGIPTDDTDTDTQVTDDTGTPPTSTAAIDGLAWRLHDTMGSLVVVSWEQTGAATVHVEYSVDTDVWMSSPSVARGDGPQEQLLVGIPFDATAQWRVVADGQDPVDGDPITTAPLAAEFPRGTLETSDPAAWLPEGKFLVTSISQEDRDWSGGWYWAYIMDRQGRVVWAKRTPDQHWTLFAQVAVTGDHLLIDEATAWADWDDGASSVVHKTYLDQEIEVVPMPGLHHAFVQLPDGTLAWGSQDHGGGEALVQRVPGGEPQVLWTVSEDWPAGNGGWGGPESNGLFYVEGTDSFLYSYYTNNSIVEVDRAGGTSMWWAGDANGGYDFDPPSSQFSWQHGISYTDTGTLLVSSEYSEGGPSRTWLLEYEVDHTNETLHLIWADDSGALADTNGQAWRLANGNTLHVVGSAGVVREVTPDGTDVWRVEYGNHYLLGHGQFVDDLYDLVAPTE